MAGAGENLPAAEPKILALPLTRLVPLSPAKNPRGFPNHHPVPPPPISQLPRAFSPHAACLLAFIPHALVGGLAFLGGGGLVIVIGARLVLSAYASTKLHPSA